MGEDGAGEQRRRAVAAEPGEQQADLQQHPPLGGHVAQLVPVVHDPLELRERILR